jgi:hypothetical protein
MPCAHAAMHVFLAASIVQALLQQPFRGVCTRHALVHGPCAHAMLLFSLLTGGPRREGGGREGERQTHRQIERRFPRGGWPRLTPQVDSAWGNIMFWVHLPPLMTCFLQLYVRTQHMGVDLSLYLSHSFHWRVCAGCQANLVVRRGVAGPCQVPPSSPPPHAPMCIPVGCIPSQCFACT